jgi:hypothetical protein
MVKLPNRFEGIKRKGQLGQAACLKLFSFGHAYSCHEGFSGLSARENQLRGQCIEAVKTAVAFAGFISAAAFAGFISAAIFAGFISAAAFAGFISAAIFAGFISAAAFAGFISAAIFAGFISAAAFAGFISAAIFAGFISAAKLPDANVDRVLVVRNPSA